MKQRKLHRFIWPAACFLTAARAQDAERSLAQIKTAVLENLRRLPNYTCTETVQRSTKPKSRQMAAVIETTRMEVAYVDGRELFGWPGASKIAEPDIGKMLGGSGGNGYFGLFAKGVFMTPSTTFQYAGPAELGGRHASRFDYRVLKSAGVYHVASEFGEAVIGFHGSFWIEVATLDLIRLEVIGDELPAAIGFASTHSTLDFERHSIGSSSFMLPRAAELVMEDTEGNFSKYNLSFAACQQFVGESLIKFDDPEVTAVSAGVPSATPEIRLPVDFTVDFFLETPIDWATSASGDPVQGSLRDDVRHNGKVIAPKGAKLSGRIAHLAKRGDLYYVELVFTTLDSQAGHASLAGRRNGVSINNNPLIYRSAGFKLRRNTRLTLHSRLLKSVQ